MAAVTQQTPNFLGGVSRQNDDAKLPNQVSECINGYPDPTYGLLKRPGMEHVNKLTKANGDAFTESELEDAIWFTIDRSPSTSYIGAIKGTNIYVWTKDNGTWCTVTNNGTSYLTGTSQSDYHFRSIQDTTVITNKNVTTAMQADGTYTENAVGTIKLVNLTESLDYTVTLQGDTITAVPQSSTTFDDFLVYNSGNANSAHHLVDAIVAHIQARHTANDSDFAGKWYIESYPNSLVLRRRSGTNQVITNYSAPTGTVRTFTLSAKGGPGNVGLEAFSDQVSSTANLPAESFDGRHVTVVNTTAAEDDFYLKYVAFDGVRGKGYWAETVARDVSPGLDADTMPHQLSNTGELTFTFGPTTWVDRQTGDDTTNKAPSFIGDKISATFFFSNRFGVLSEDNIFLGVANDSFNFFNKSAITQVDSDPIDLNVASIRPATLFDVLPSPQGLLLFSARQQFQLYAAEASQLTPKTAVIKSISSYEMSDNVAPVDLGVTAAFINTVPGAGKLFTLQLQDIEENPLVVDISKTVLEWIPDTIDGIAVSPQNSVVTLIDRDSAYIYLFRYYNNGERDLFQAWTKWQLPATIQIASIIGDDLTIVTQHEDEYTLNKITLDQIPSGEVIATAGGTDGNPCLDMFTRPVIGYVGTVEPYREPGTGTVTATDLATTTTIGAGTGLTVDVVVGVGNVISSVTVNNPGSGYKIGDRFYITNAGYTGSYSVTEMVASVVYDETNDITKIYTPYTPIDNKKATMLLTVPTADVDTDDVINADAGYYAEAIERIETGTGARYFEVKGDFSGYADGIVVGYGYDFEVTLPKFYYRPEPTRTDFTANLTISRVKFSVGRTGPIRFEIKADGSNLWKPVESTADGDYYAADSNPVKAERQVVVPIHQRNSNFELKVTSDFPYPVSLVSMMWEGVYSPRFYRRA